MRLKGKVALVTGAARGIGRGIAEVFAAEGADVAVNDVDQMQLAEEVAAAIRSAGRRALTVQADVAKRSDVEPMIERVWQELGPIDILVNNAGIETIVPFLELPRASGPSSTSISAGRGCVLRCSAGAWSRRSVRRRS